MRFSRPWGNRIQVGDLSDESLVWLLPYQEVQKAGITFAKTLACRIRKRSDHMKNLERVRTLAKDLTKTYPRSPREMLGGYVIGARCADKCRHSSWASTGNITIGLVRSPRCCSPYGDQSGPVQGGCRNGATDEELGDWAQEHSKVQDRQAIIEWNNTMQGSASFRRWLRRYRPIWKTIFQKYVPNHRPVYTYFDVYDLEEQRL